jgi:hypothetical protein
MERQLRPGANASPGRSSSGPTLSPAAPGITPLLAPPPLSLFFQTNIRSFKDELFSFTDGLRGVPADAQICAAACLQKSDCKARLRGRGRRRRRAGPCGIA